jgi:hypothetical protein
MSLARCLPAEVPSINKHLLDRPVREGTPLPVKDCSACDAQSYICAATEAQIAVTYRCVDVPAAWTDRKRLRRFVRVDELIPFHPLIVLDRPGAPTPVVAPGPARVDAPRAPVPLNRCRWSSSWDQDGRRAVGIGQVVRVPAPPHAARAALDRALAPILRMRDRRRDEKEGRIVVDSTTRRLLAVPIRATGSSCNGPMPGRRCAGGPARLRSDGQSLR